MNGMRAIHPSEILKDELDELKLSANTLAKALDVPTNRITAILNEQRGITAGTALRLAKFFGTSPDFWMSLQSSYDVKSHENKKDNNGSVQSNRPCSDRQY